MRDFTLDIYIELLSALKNAGYQFLSFSDYLQKERSGKYIMLRHDVDNRKDFSLEFARIQHAIGIRATYYFRMVPASFDAGVIKEIYRLGHEIGYHYEDMDFVKGDPDKAIGLFEKHLAMLRNIVPINTICMHGSPKSAYDNKDVWKKYSYKNYGIIGEPYFDIDFNSVYYITDTGKMWDGHKVSVRDKVKSKTFKQTYHSTRQIIDGINQGAFPDKVMINFHPQRWTNNKWLWYKDSTIQLLKNNIKRFLVK
jgi:hypothetical protein